jgi:hypothetical protein
VRLNKIMKAARIRGGRVDLWKSFDQFSHGKEDL